MKQAADQQIQSRTPHAGGAGSSVDVHPTRTTEGRITWSDLSGSSAASGVKFKLSGSDDTYEITAATVASTGRSEELARYLHPGALVRVEAHADDLHVTQFTSNFGTVYQKNLLTAADTSKAEDSELQADSDRGTALLTFGILFLPLLFAGRFFWKKRRAVKAT